MENKNNREWSCKDDVKLNFTIGCSNGCLYCYAKAGYVKNGWYARHGYLPCEWSNERIRFEVLRQPIPKKLHGKEAMFPTTHDITPFNLNHSLFMMKKAFDADMILTVVSKPRFNCIKTICNEFENYKSNIIFKFTIGSTDSNILKFWEPNASNFDERLKSLKYVFEKGFKTSVSCEPLLDKNVDDIIEKLQPFTTETIWLGKMNKATKQLLSRNGYKKHINIETDEILKRADELLLWQSDDNFWKNIYQLYKDNDKIKWKGDLKKTLGI